MIAWRNYFARHKGNIPPEAHNDVKWSGKRLTVQVISGRLGGERGLWGGKVGQRSTLMGYVQILPCYVVIPAKIDKWKL